MASPYKDQLDDMQWSFSRINSYNNCAYGWKLQYIDKVEQASSGFADWGSLCHSIFEDYAKGKLMDFELLDAYESRYQDYMHGGFPPVRGKPLSERYYERGVELFSEFDGFPTNWEILAVEQKVEMEIRGFRFQGYIDLLVRDRNDHRLIVVDHKSKKEFKSADEKEHYALQLYLYALWVYQTYNEYPKELYFNMFRAGTTEIITFNEDSMLKAVSWLCDSIKKIYEDEDFWDKIAIEYDTTGKLLSEFQHKDFYCNNLCSVRKFCTRSKDSQS